MKILFIAQLFPYPLDQGIKIKTYKILKVLSQSHEIYFVSFADDSQSLKYEKNLKLFCQKIKTIIHPVITKRHKKLLPALILSLFSNKPFFFYKFFSLQMKEYINNILQLNNFEAIYLDNLALTQYIPLQYRGYLFYDESNIPSLQYKLYYHFEHNLLFKFIFKLESYKSHKLEEKLLPKFNHIFSISAFDKKYLVKIGCKPQNISILPIPFRGNYVFNPPNNENVILFIGSFSWFPNEVGILWFIQKVYPIVKAKIPQVKLKIIGGYGDKVENFINESKDKNIEFLGYKTRVEEIYKRSCVFIAPIVNGSGIPIKILDAMSHGIPVASTNLAVEGIKVKNGQDLLIGNNPNALAEAVIRIIKDKSLARRLSKNSYKFIKKNYNSMKTKDALNKINNKKFLN